MGRRGAFHRKESVSRGYIFGRCCRAVARLGAAPRPDGDLAAAVFARDLLHRPVESPVNFIACKAEGRDMRDQETTRGSIGFQPVAKDRVNPAALVDKPDQVRVIPRPTVSPTNSTHRVSERPGYRQETSG